MDAVEKVFERRLTKIERRSLLVLPAELLPLCCVLKSKGCVLQNLQFVSTPEALQLSLLIRSLAEEFLDLGQVKQAIDIVVVPQEVLRELLRVTEASILG